jgi:mono/diheme cytochrome c family protein
MVFAIALLWIILGLGVFFLAMRRGHAASREAGGLAEPQPESKAARRWTILGVGALIVFGLAVPAFVLAANVNDKASVTVGGVHLTASQEKGRELFAHSCVYCHTLAAVKSYARTGPNLDVRVGDDISTPAGRKALVLSAISEGRARGLGQMPAGLYQGREAQEVAEFVAAVAGH